MYALASDNFTRADSANLGANWTKLSGFGDIGITSNQAKGQSASFNVCAYTALGTIVANQYSKVTIGSPASNGGPTVRSNLTNTCYFLQVYDDGFQLVILSKFIAGAQTQMVLIDTHISSGDVFSLDVQGNTLTVRRNNNILKTLDDSSIDGVTVGGLYAGIMTQNVSVTFSAFEMGGAVPDLSNSLGEPMIGSRIF